MYKFFRIGLAVVCLLVARPAWSGQNENLVLHRPYTYFPKPLYNNCQDTGDITERTDGVTHYAGNMGTSASSSMSMASSG